MPYPLHLHPSEEGGGVYFSLHQNHLTHLVSFSLVISYLIRDSNVYNCSLVSNILIIQSSLKLIFSILFDILSLKHSSSSSSFSSPLSVT